MGKVKKEITNFRNYINIVSRYICSSILVIAGVSLGTFISLYFIDFLLNKDFIHLLTGYDYILVNTSDHSTLSAEELKSINNLIKSGHILTQDQLLNSITEHYNVMINILIVIVSILAALAYFSIKSLSKAHAEEIVENQVEKEVKYALTDKNTIANIFYENDTFRELMDASESRSKITEISQKKLNNLESRVIGLEFMLMQNDNETTPEQE